MKKFEEPIITVVKFNAEESVFTLSFNDIKKHYETDKLPLDDDLAL